MMHSLTTRAYAALIASGAATLLVGCASHPTASDPPVRNTAASPSAPAAASPAIVKPAGYSAETTPIGTLLDNPVTRAILNEYIPGFSSAPGVEMARDMTLKAAQAFSPSTLTDAVLAKIDAALAKVPAAQQ